MKPSTSGQSAAGIAGGAEMVQCSGVERNAASGAWPRPSARLHAIPRPTPARKPYRTLREIALRRNAGSDTIRGSGS